MSQADQSLTPSFSTLVLSIGSSAAMAMGLAPKPGSEKPEVDLPMARFHIDLLLLLKEKTKSNLDNDEQKFLESVLNDLQLKFVQLK